MRIFAALLFLIASCSGAFATIKICNEFKYPIHIAFAYETKDGWVSDGWTTVKSDACEVDTKHADLTSFYYRAETDLAKTTDGKITIYQWGTNRAFSVPKDGLSDFKFENAETKAKGARLAEFNGPDTFKKASTTVTLTFELDLKVTFFTPKEDN